jgi:hypothetical protein
MSIQSTEILRSQNFIARCDFWFAITALDGVMHIPNTAQQVVRRSPVLADYINHFDVSQLTDDSVVFCKFDYLQYMIQYLEHHHCKTSFVLLTGQSDYPITDAAHEFVCSRIPVRWWGCNNESSKANGVPLGIADDFCTLTIKSDFEQTKGTRLLYVNHRTETFPMVRQPLYPLFADKPWATVRTPMEKGKTDTYKEELLDHKFILCPRGNGVDTHRMWEALYCGVIPVVQRSPVHSGIEGNLPVLFVDSYYEVTEELLNTTYQFYKTKTWNWDILKISWWMEEFRRVKDVN